MKNQYYRIVNALKIFLWAFKNPLSLNATNFKMLSGLLEMIFKVSKENNPYMSKIAVVYPDNEIDEVVTIWAGATHDACPTKRISELIKENNELKAKISESLKDKTADN